jgi:hypothetical protein
LFGLLSARLVRKGRADPASQYLEAKQRIRPLMLEYLDPIITLIVVGPVLAHELNIGALHILLGVVGACAGIPIGLLRSRVQYVRAIENSKSVVLTRSKAEYFLLILLIAIRSSEDSIRSSTATGVTLLVAFLLAFPLGESCARSYSIVKKYQREVNESPSL